MELAYSDVDEAFRAELPRGSTRRCRALAAQPARDAWDARRKWDTDWQRRLFDAGYAGLHWPKEYGGRGASPTEQLIFYEETAGPRAPYVGVNFVGTLHAGPTLIEEGTDEQKAAHLPKILRGDEVWCQGFSEPGAGSDLASLRTRAERDGDDYVLNGQKIWCSFGQIADVGEFLVRTDPDAPKHKGISWLILPMNTPGIEMRPITDRARAAPSSAEVFLNDVRVPVANRVGAENDGWRVTNVTLKYERGTAFVSELVDASAFVRRPARRTCTIRRICARAGPLRGGVRRAVGAHEAQRVAGAARHDRRGRDGDQARVHGSAAAVRRVVPAGAWARRVALDDNELVEERLRVLALTIAAGASQIQRNIIGERVLGLPREPR